MWGGADKTRLLCCNRGWHLWSPGMFSENVLEAEISIIQLAGSLDLPHSLFINPYGTEKLNTSVAPLGLEEFLAILVVLNCCISCVHLQLSLIIFPDKDPFWDVGALFSVTLSTMTSHLKPYKWNASFEWPEWPENRPLSYYSSFQIPSITVIQTKITLRLTHFGAKDYSILIMHFEDWNQEVKVWRHRHYQHLKESNRGYL